MCEKNLQVPQHLKQLKKYHIYQNILCKQFCFLVELKDKKQYLVINEWID
jgi:hypothetical protein